MPHCHWSYRWIDPFFCLPISEFNFFLDCEMICFTFMAMDEMASDGLLIETCESFFLIKIKV
jgi:hypothetical protein